MKTNIARHPNSRVLLAFAVSAASVIGQARGQAPIPPSLVTPDKVESRIGALEFKDGQPNKVTLEKVYDNLDFQHATHAFADTLQGVSIHAIRKGLQDMCVKDNEVIVFSELMDSKSLFLTPNADTIYIISGFDLSKGPIVVEVPPGILGTVQDAWFHWVIDMGPPGPDRGEGGKYLIVPPDYDGSLPEGEFSVVHSRTIHGMGPIAAIGIVKGKPFAPDACLVRPCVHRERERSILNPRIQTWKTALHC